MTRVLVVEDEPILAGTIANYLQRAGMETQTATEGMAAVAAARSWHPDVIILDLGLPGIDGLEVCRQVRTFSDCYIIMLTARADEVDMLVGLSIGADDYITKPFRNRELVVRVQVLLRRPRTHTTPQPQQLLQFGPLKVILDSREVYLDGSPIELTRTEFDVLAALASKPNLVWSRRQLIDSIWGSDWVGDEHLVDVHVAHVRKKLGSDKFIKTVRGIGYRMGNT